MPCMIRYLQFRWNEVLLLINIPGSHHSSTYPLMQAAIKELLPAALEDPHGKIRTAVGMAIASIANWDWPEEWPGLMGYLLSLINDRTDINKGSDYGIRGHCKFIVECADCVVYRVQRCFLACECSSREPNVLHPFHGIQIFL